MINTTRVLGKHSVLILSDTAGRYSAKLINFNKDIEWQFAELCKNTQLILVNHKKDLFMADLSTDCNKISLKGKLTLPKGLTHGYSEDEKIYMFDKAGDIYSQNIELISKELKDTGDKEEISKAIHLETSNFCALTALALGNIGGKKMIALADQYYKIRLIDREDYHRLVMSVSLRNRYTESLVIVQEKYLLVHYDDSKLQLLGDEEIKDSMNINTKYLEHDFIGKLDIFSLENTNLLIVFARDAKDIYLAELKPEELTLKSVDKISLSGEADSQYHLALNKETLLLTVITKADMEAKEGLTETQGEVRDLRTEHIKVDLNAKKLTRE